MRRWRSFCGRQKMPPRKGWAAVYCRLSKEDEDKAAAESESIRNQRALLLDWAATHGYHVYKVYTDEDYSGIDRARPGFNAMLNDARQGKFEVILAKTQSRFTRDMELVERYLHGLFPEWGVRFIAVLDHVDTCDPAGKKARQINGLINEWYLEDLSGNVRAVLDHKRHSGCYIASFALYGYRKDPADHSRLLPDPEAAAVVRHIFALYLQGYGTARIAHILNAEGIPPPSGKGKSWSSTMVLRLLRGEKYCGDLLQRKSCTPDFLDHRKVKNEGQSPQVYLRDHHEVIVPRLMFEAVQRELDRRQANRKAGSRPSARYWCSGKVVCGRCGSRFVPRRGAQADGGLRWVCGKRVQHGVAACAAPAVGNRILLNCMKQITQDLPIDMEMVLRQTLRAIPDLTRTERQQFCTILRKNLYSKTVYSALLDYITATGEGLTVYLHGVSEPLHFELSGREKPSVQRTDG